MNRVPALLLWIISGAACLSDTIDPESVILFHNIKEPADIYVGLFSCKGGEWTPAASEDARRTEAERLRGKMIDALNDVAPSHEAPQPLPATGLFITGEFLKVEEDEKAAAKIMIFDLERSSVKPAIYFNAEASGSLESVWKEIAAATTELVEAKVLRTEINRNRRQSKK